MAKPNRGGRRAAAAQSQPATQDTQDTTQQAAVSTPPPTPAPAPTNPNAYKKFTDTDAAKLRKAMDDYYDADATDAIKLYISNSDPNKDGFSHSQNLNYKLMNGKQLNATEQFIDDNIQNAMHPIGSNIKLYRYSHDDILKSLGVQDYSKMTESQLKKQLIGRTFQTTSYLSTSYDEKMNPFRPRSNIRWRQRNSMGAKYSRKHQSSIWSKSTS